MVDFVNRCTVIILSCVFVALKIYFYEVVSNAI